MRNFFEKMKISKFRADLGTGGIFDGPYLSRIAGVRDRWLYLGVWCLKSQIPSTKLQINLKLKIPNSKPVPAGS